MTNGAENALDQNVSSDGSVVTGQRLTLLAYLLAVSLPVLVLYLRLIVMHYKAGDPPAMIFFLIPVIICAYLGGVWPGVLATLLAGLAVGYFLLPPLHSLAISDWIHKTQWLAMLTEGILISLLTESLLRVRRKGKEAYQSLQKNQALLSGVISSTMDGIIAVDSNHRVTLFNPGAEQMFGCTAQEAVGQPLNRFIPERLRTRHTLHINEFARSDVSHQMTGKSGPLYGLRNNGTEFPIAASISQIDMSGHRMYAALVRDATEQKQAEEHLRRNRDRLSLALDVSKLGTYDRYIPEDRMEWSERALEIMGLPSGTSLSYDQYLEMLHPEDRATMERAREESWKSNRDFETELRIIWPDGSSHWLVVRGRPYHDELGRPLRSSGVIQDITHKKKVEEAQLRSQKLESLGTLTGGIAHDFNNILFAISGNAEQASDDLPSDHPGQFSLNEIKKGARRAADLVRQILTFSLPRDEKHEILQVERVVDEAVKMMRATLPAIIEIRTSFAPGLPPANVDPSQIHQIVVNLTTNASHAIGNHAGVIEVLLTATVVGTEESALRQVTPGRYVLLEVTDNGCGMDEATRERIFDPFTTKPVGQGTGLGLFVVDGIARSHGGAVTVYSEPGKGTVFHVYLPVAHKHAEAQPVKATVPVPRGDKWHVLYVDDEEALVSLVSRRLSRLGYEVTGFTDAEEALREFASRPGNFDAIVTDLSMPRLSGFDLLRQVLTLRPNIATVMTTGYLRPEDHEMAQQIGVQEIILKPGTTEELGIALDALLRKSGKHRE